MRSPASPDLWMFLVLRSPDALSERGLLAHVGACLGVSVVPVAAEVIDLRVEICPHNDVQLDMATLVWTRGYNFPLDMLQSRLRCPKCGQGRLTVVSRCRGRRRRARSGPGARRAGYGVRRGQQREKSPVPLHRAARRRAEATAPSRMLDYRLLPKPGFFGRGQHDRSSFHELYRAPD